MKRGLLIGFTVAISLCLLMGAASNAPKYWQNELLTLSPQWLNVFGYTPDSILAYQDWVQNKKDAMHDAELTAIKQRLLKLESAVVDPNEAVE